MKYCNPDFFSRLWVGVELDTPTKKNDCSMKGTRYFKCKPRHGPFVSNFRAESRSYHHDHDLGE